MAEQRFRSGCAFWPRTKGPFFLAGESLFDEGELREELSHVADVGFDFVRVALPWVALQPSTSRLNTSVLDRLAALLEAAERATLTVQLTLLGQLGGTLFLPEWMLLLDPLAAQRTAGPRIVSEGRVVPWPAGNLYAARTLLDAQQKVWGEIAFNFAAHPALTELDLGAGGVLTMLPPQNEEEGLRWWELLEERIGEAAQPPALLYSDTPALLFRPELPKLATWQQAVGQLALAVSPAASRVARSGVDEAWPAFLLLLTRALAGAPVACASLGVPTRQREEDDDRLFDPEEETPRATRYTEEAQARFFSEVLPALHQLAVPFICHALWADAPADLYPQPPFDLNLPLRYSGLLRADGSEKEAASIWRTFNRQVAGEAGGAGRALDLDPEEWYRRRDEEGFLESLYKQFLAGER